MKIWVGITDDDWFEYLRASNADEVNFWQPSGGQAFRALSPGEPFLFKLHSPMNFIVGGGFYVRSSALPVSLAWEAFGEKNGVHDRPELLARVEKYRRPDRAAQRRDPDPVIGCNILTQPFFFPGDAWIPVPTDWAPNIVRGKAYDTSDRVGADLWAKVEMNLGHLPVWQLEGYGVAYPEDPRYWLKGRLGQGAFRVLVTDAYHRRCAVTGERTLPVLEAAHIKPHSESGPNLVQNGLLLRSDLHILFDNGYLTVTPDLHVEVSGRIKEEFDNGREYYAHHGQSLIVLPDQAGDRPAKDFLAWHNEHVYAG